MSFESPASQSTLLNTLKRTRDWSRDVLESTAQGFVFPVHEKIRAMPDERIARSDADTEGVSKRALFKVSLRALSTAWEHAIQPRMAEIRANNVSTLKKGTDFFTEADTASEEVIRNAFMETFGEQSLRIFGEEANKYMGNLNSRIGVRIDPIDGTESFKFDKQMDWGIMVGIYVGTPQQERQLMSTVYFPERHILLYAVDGVGVFTTNVNEATGMRAAQQGTKEYTAVDQQDDISNIITSQWKHSDITQRGEIDRIEAALTQNNARIRSTNSSCAAVLEALESNGKRAIILDGDFNQVDFIPFHMLEMAGYAIYDWTGVPQRADDAGLTNKKLVIVPPGRAGEEIIAIIKRLA